MDGRFFCNFFTVRVSAAVFSDGLLLASDLSDLLDELSLDRRRGSCNRIDLRQDLDRLSAGSGGASEGSLEGSLEDCVEIRGDGSAEMSSSTFRSLR